MEISVWDVLFSIGGLGRLLVNLAFVSAGISAISLFLSLRSAPEHSKTWQKFGFTAFIIHAASVFGIIITLFTMIYLHKYEYHYVWSHSSNELPVHFMISCFWEGQEGSFLLWIFWHVVLGLAILWKGGRWKAGVLSVLTSVQVMLSSMLIGVWLPENTVRILLSLLLLLLLGACLLQQAKIKQLRVTAGILTGISILLIWKSWSGSGLMISSTISEYLISGENLLNFVVPSLVFITLIFTFIPLLQEYIAWQKPQRTGAYLTLFTTALWILTCVLILVPISHWTLGSSPFLLLREAMPDAPVFANNPGFVPGNGTGLNPLLQNYWMVIHPPTLFLGFASTLIPFAYLITGLLKGEAHAWIKPASPWNLFAALILGTGIMMGGYWAYETLSFGGYWNWDPVENSSLVPWITCIASLHAFVAWNQKKTQLRFAYLLVILTFLLVLYSTFLTRSGILGEASVHSFTDLGLSGQLLILLGIYFTGVLLLWLRKRHLVPEETKESPLLSREFFLFLASAILLFTAIEIIFFTSSPVINKIFGLSIAPKNPLFYFKWNVWFSMAIAILSGIGQFIFWHKHEKTALLKALYRPFSLAVFSSLGILILMILQDWNFVYNETFRNDLEAIKLNSSTFMYYFNVLIYACIFVADELMLIASLFTIFANADVLIRLIRKHTSNIKLIGGSLAHLGFGLMLLGILFSSGFDSIVSVNFKPGELGSMFPEDSRNDNVLLLKNEPKFIKGYQVSYLGKKQAEAPVRNIKVLEWDEFSLKVKFTDATGDDFSIMLPAEIFLSDEQAQKAESRFNTEKTSRFIEENLSILKPEHLNQRSLYAIKFVAMEDTSRSFILYPEAELNKSMGILAHPDRKVRLQEDIYVHVSSIPDPDSQEEEMQEFTLRMAKGDSAHTSGSMIILENLVQVKDVPELDKYDFVAKAKLRILKNGKEYKAEPLYIIDNRQPISLAAVVREAGISFTFAGVDVDAGKIVLKVEELSEPPDWVVIKAIAKPWINLLWLGTFLLTVGFGIAIWRRVSLKSTE